MILLAFLYLLLGSGGGDDVSIFVAFAMVAELMVEAHLMLGGVRAFLHRRGL